MHDDNESNDDAQGSDDADVHEEDRKGFQGSIQRAEKAISPQKMDGAEVRLPTQDLDGQGEGIESLPPDKRNLAFDIIRKVRDKLKPEVAKVKSQADYARKFSRLTSKLGEPGLKPDVEIWTASLAPYLDAPNSFRANRAALLFGLRDRMRRAMAAQDSIRRNRGAAINWLKQVLLLQSLDKILSHVEASPRDAAFWASKVGKRRHGTRKKTRLGDH